MMGDLGEVIGIDIINIYLLSITTITLEVLKSCVLSHIFHIICLYEHQRNILNELHINHTYFL